MTLQQSKIVLADATKKRLKSLTIELRRLLEEDLGKQLKRLGIDPGKSAPVPVANLSYLTEEEQAIRYALDAVATKEQAMAGSYSIAVESLRREAAYTHLNRLVGLKCLELRGHLRIEGELTEVVTCRPEYGSRSKWLWTLREREKKYRYGEDAEELLWRDGLIQACAAITTEIRVLFDPDDPYAQVWPSYKALRETVDKLNELPEEAFRADELLGWIYQYFQSEEKARVFEEARTKKKKITWQDIVPVTQLYTERYMVDFLLQNSIGTRWMEMYPDSDAKADWPYYVTPATPHTRSPKALKEWSILDLCVGSGHFLIVTFDLLAQLYAEERKLAETGRIPQDWTVPANEVAVTILERNLHGIDIDPRAVQIAALALYLKAKEHGLTSGGRPPVLNLVVADAVLTRGQAYEELLSQYKQDIVAREAIEAIWHALENLRELGSLVRVEEDVEEAIRKAKTKEDRHSPLLSSAKDWEQYKNTLLSRLKEAFVAETRSNDLNERIFGLEGVKGVGLLELLGRRYDVVCTNPPYMGSKNMGSILKDFVAKHYAPGKRDLYATFILRCHQLAKQNGHVAMVTQQGWMFLRSYADLRAIPEERLKSARRDSPGLLRRTTIELVVHLGTRAFAEVGGDVVSTTLLVCLNQSPSVEHRLSVIRVIDLETTSAKTAILKNVNLHRNRLYIRRQSSYLMLPLFAIPYWVDESVITLFQGNKQLTTIALPFRGLDCGDTRRFLRFDWEVSDYSQWVPHSKGGGYSKWWGFDFYRVEWKDNGQQIRRYPGSIIPNEQYYFLEHITYSYLANYNLSVRLAPVGTMVGVTGPGILPDSPDNKWKTMALLNTRFATYLMRLMSPGLRFPTGYLQGFPISDRFLKVNDRIIIEIAERAFLTKYKFLEYDLNERNFRGTFDFRSEELLGCYFSRILHDEKLAVVLCTFEGYIEEMVQSLFELNETVSKAIFDELGMPAGGYPLINDYDILPELRDGKPFPQELREFIQSRSHLSCSNEDLIRIKDRVRALYVAGPGSKLEINEEVYSQKEELEDEGEDTVPGARIPIPAETFLEELSQKIEIHPISVYWLLEEMRREEGLVCPPEMKRQTEDYFSVNLLRMLGHRWPMQDQYEKEEGKSFIGQKWVDEDGIIPLTPGTGEETLIERFHRFLDEEFTQERGPSVEIEAGQILGWKPGDEWGKQKATTLGRWFEREFFKRHISQFKKRPIAWHFSSKEGTFQIIVYYHKFDKNRLTILRARHVREVLDSLGKQLGEAQSGEMDRQTLAKIVDLEKKIADIQEFDERLRRLLEGREREARIWCPWKKPEDQPVGWNPDINDGVRVNIAPVQRLGLLAADVLATKDLKSLLAPERRN